MTRLANTPLSVLDLSFVVAGGSGPQALRETVELARHVDALGYERFWVAEHHNLPSVASGAPDVMSGQILAATQRIRVGSGGVMLPNHAPLMVAERFKALEALFPGRVDLGLGRAPGTDMRTARALRRNLEASADSFPRDIIDLQRLLGPRQEEQAVIAVPGNNSNVPLWLLGSSLYSAHLAAALGLPYAFASHFAPDQLMEAIAIYRERFEPSEQLQKPYVMVGAMAVAAGTDAEAQRLFTSAQQQFINLRRNVRRPFPRPVETMDGLWSDAERMGVEHTLRYAVVGAASTAEEKLSRFLQETGADELIISTPVHDVEARLRSIEIFSTFSGVMKPAR
jgi:Coenzyme F420-dependent N5,N10-methylene tetrahydromethanopterin reductase and related flavin-dependent oxidoreductases